MGKTMIISASYRINGNGDTVADFLAKGFQDAGKEYEVVYLRDKNIGPCRGCLACMKTGRCVFDDDMIELTEKIKGSTNLILVTPVYYYSLPGQLKVMIDRLNPLYELPGEKELKNVYLLVTCAEKDKETAKPLTEELRSFVNVVPGIELKESYTIASCYEEGDAARQKEELEYVYNMAKSM